MKHTAFNPDTKFLSTTLLLILGTVLAHAQYYQLIIRTDDGLVTPYNVSRVDSVYFEYVDDENDNDEDETTVTGNATDITSSTATITSWANILDNLSTDLKVGIIYTSEGTPNKSNGTQETVSTSSLGSDAKYTINLTNLAPATTYYYRSFVYQSDVWFYGNVKSFTTKKQGVDLVSGEVTKLTCYSAKVSGAISMDEFTQYQSLSYGICYSTNSTPTANNGKVQASGKDNDGNFTCQLRALTGSVTYYYRSYAYVDNYLYYGPIRSFTTKDDDVVITGDIDLETYTVRSTLKIGSGAYSTLVLGVCYGTSETPTINDKTVITNEVDDESNFELSLTSKPLGTVYYRSYVLIDNVAHYGEVKSFEKTRDENGYECVDLGLSVLWATFNVGAESPEDYGDYFAWGETETKSTYNWSTYKYCNGSYTTMTKYCNDSEYGYNGFTDTLTTLLPDDDVAHVRWGGSWRMPTLSECQELVDNCDWTWTSQNGVKGYKVTSRVDSCRSIFLPAAGQILSFSYYLSSTLFKGDPSEACYLFFSESGRGSGSISRCSGRSVRPVCASETCINNISVTLNKNKMYLSVGEAETLTTTVKDGSNIIDNSIITWTSSYPSVATVDSNGKVTAISVGTACIIATYNGKTDICSITVVNPY